MTRLFFIWLYFDCEMWTNPQWSFGWPPTLFVWMGRRACRSSFALLGELLEARFGTTSFFAFRVLVCRLWLRCLSIYILWLFDIISLSMFRWYFIFGVLLRFIWHGYSGDVLFSCWWDIIISLQCIEKIKLCMFWTYRRSSI